MKYYNTVKKMWTNASYAFAMIQMEKKKTGVDRMKTLRDGNSYKTTLRLLCLTLPQRKQRSNVSNVLQALKQGDEMQEFVVGGIADPAFDGDGVVWDSS